MIIFWIIVALLIFSFVILIHEFGHFFAARKFGVKVLEFGLGLPPKTKEIFKDKHGTKYTLNWLPLGGFVRLDGENPHLTSPKGEEQKTPSPSGEGWDEDTKFYNKNYFQKSIILLAGVFMNFLLASIIFSVLFFTGIKPIGVNTIIPNNLNSKLIPTYNEAIRDGLLTKNNGLILNPIKGSIAEKAGIKSGDIIYEIYQNCKKYKSKICGIEQDLFLIKKINNFKDFKNILEKNKNKELIFLINQNKKTGLGGSFIPLKIGKNGKIGAYIGENIKINEDFKYKFSFLNSIKYGFKETYIQSILTLKGLKYLWIKIYSPKDKKERSNAIKQMSGPIGIVDFIATNAKEGIIFLIIFTAIISVNLGVFNLLPIPALDGGRWFLLTLNTILSKLSSGKINIFYLENFLHLIFFIILIALSIFIGYNDIEKIINK